MYSENYKTMMKEIKDDTNRWKDIPCSWIERINIVKMTILPKAIYKIQCNLYQTTNGVFHRTRTKCFKIYMETQKTQNGQSNLEGETKGAGRIRLPSFRLYYKATVIKTEWYSPKTRNIDQWNMIERPEINPHTYGQSIYDKEGKNISWREDRLFNKWFWENCKVTCKRMESEHSLHHS